MTIKRGITSIVNLDYTANALDTYEIRLKGCNEIIAATYVSSGCLSHTLFSITVDCNFITGVFDYELLENSIAVSEGIIFIND